MCVFTSPQGGLADCPLMMSKFIFCTGYIIETVLVASNYHLSKKNEHSCKEAFRCPTRGNFDSSLLLVT